MISQMFLLHSRVWHLLYLTQVIIPTIWTYGGCVNNMQYKKKKNTYVQTLFIKKNTFLTTIPTCNDET